MKEKWLHLVSLFEKHTQREKMLFSACIIAGIYGVWFFVFESALIINQQALAQRFDALTLATEKTKKIQQLFSDASLSNPSMEKEKKKEIKRLENRLVTLDRDLEALSVGLVSAFDLSNVLRDVLNSNKKMRLIGLTSLPSEALSFNGLHLNNTIKEVASNRESVEIMYDEFQNKIRREVAERDIVSESRSNNISVFKHTVVIRLEGGYFDMVDYLSALENLPWKFYWSELDYHVVEYPKAIVTLEVYTLSTGKGVSRE